MESQGIKNIPFYGYTTGLTIALDARLDDYASSPGLSDGFKILVHYLPTYPDVGERGFLVSPGFEMHCGINPQSSYNSPIFDNLEVNERKCYLQSENILKYYSHYSMSNCFVECLTDKMLAQCSCRPFYYAGNLKH